MDMLRRPTKCELLLTNDVIMRQCAVSSSVSLRHCVGGVLHGDSSVRLHDNAAGAHGVTSRVT